LSSLRFTQYVAAIHASRITWPYTGVTLCFDLAVLAAQNLSIDLLLPQARRSWSSTVMA